MSTLTHRHGEGVVGISKGARAGCAHEMTHVRDERP